jgi:large subunit ribosomal protein L13
MKTSTIPVSAPSWYLLDAKEQSVGRMAAKIATMLRGKHKVSFSAHQLCGDHIVVVNAKELSFPQKKRMQKLYYDHSGFMGHMRTTNLEDMMRKNPTRVVEDAVRRMLPKNRLRKEMMKRLHIFAAAEHTHTAQQPIPLSLS